MPSSSWLLLLLACPPAEPEPTDTDTDTDTDAASESSTRTDTDIETDTDTGCEGAPCRLVGEAELEDADALIEGAGVGAGLGLGVGSLGDVDGDGRPDFSVGARRQDDAGAVYLFAGAPTGEVDPEDAWAIVSGTDGSQVGYGLDGVGDVDGDGSVDLVVGDYQWRGAGRALLLLGPFAGEHDVSEAVWEAEGTDDNGRFGFTVAGLGDLDDDGYADFAVSGYLDETERGHVRVVHGGATSEDRSEQILLGLEEYDNAGRGLSGGADLDGDGLGELLVGSRFADPDGPNSGEVYVLAGPATSVASLTEATATLTGTTNEHAGWSLDATHDLDGDGYGDVVVGGQYDTGTGGRLWFVHGPVTDDAALEDRADAQLFGLSPFDDFARDLDVGDVDGDGLPDVLVGAREGADPGRDAGGAWLAYGPFTGSRSVGEAGDWFGRGGAEGDYAGEDVALPGDLDGDGYGELLIGAWQAAGEVGPGAGKAYLFYGTGR